MPPNFPRITARFTPIDVEPFRPEIGQQLEYVDNVGLTYDELSVLAREARLYAGQLNALAESLAELADTKWFPRGVDAEGAAPGSAAYLAKLAAEPPEPWETAIGRFLLVTNAAANAAGATSHWHIAEDTASGPRWSDSLLHPGATDNPELGLVDDIMMLAYTDATALQHTFRTSDGSDYVVMYGDGTEVLLVSGVAHTKTFGSASSGVACFIARAPATLSRFDAMDGGWSFNLADLPGSFIRLAAVGTNTIGGVVEDLPASATQLIVAGQNTIGGTLAALPPGMEKINLQGQNTITGAVPAVLPTTLDTLVALGNSTLTVPVMPSFGDTMAEVVLRNAAIPAPDLTRLLQGLTAVSTWIAPASVNVGNSNPALNAAGLIARDTLVAAGVTVIHN